MGAFETYNSISKGVADIGVGFRYGVGCPFTDEIFAMALMGTPSVAVSTKVVEDCMKNIRIGIRRNGATPEFSITLPTRQSIFPQEIHP